MIGENGQKEGWLGWEELTEKKEKKKKEDSKGLNCYIIYIFIIK